MEGAAAPEAWGLSRICEEFGCLPSEAIRQPMPTTLAIVDLRAYARAKAALERWEADARPAREKGDPPSGPMVDAVRANRTALVRNMAAEGRKKRERGKRGNRGD